MFFKSFKNEYDYKWHEIFWHAGLRLHKIEPKWRIKILFEQILYRREWRILAYSLIAIFCCNGFLFFKKSISKSRLSKIIQVWRGFRVKVRYGYKTTMVRKQRYIKTKEYILEQHEHLERDQILPYWLLHLAVLGKC